MYYWIKYIVSEILHVYEWILYIVYICTGIFWNMLQELEEWTYTKKTHISNIERNTNKNVKLDWEFKPGTLASLIRCSTSELSRLINIHGSSWQNYHIPPLQIFCHLRNTQQTHVHPVRTYWFNEFLINDHSTKLLKMRKNIEKNIFFTYMKEKYRSDLTKTRTQNLVLIYTHIPVLEL